MNDEQVVPAEAPAPEPPPPCYVPLADYVVTEGREMMPSEISRITGLTPRQIEHLIDSALRKLRKALVR